MNKKFVLIGNIISSFMVLISMFLPYFHIFLENDEQTEIVREYNVNIFGAGLIGIGYVIISIILVILAIKNYKKTLKKEKIINPKIILFLNLILLTAVYQMQISLEMSDWLSDEYGYWLHSSISFGYYVFRIVIALGLFNSILLIIFKNKFIIKEQ